MAKRHGVPIKLAADAEERSLASIKRFFKEHMDDDVGDLKAKLLLDFFLEEIGPSVYNRAITDAQAVMQDRVVDLDGTCYQPEFSYWR